MNLAVILCLFLIAFSQVSFASRCEVSSTSLAIHEEEIVKIAEALKTETKSALFLREAAHPLQCVFYIQMRSSGMLKAIANQFVTGLFRKTPQPEKLKGRSYHLVRKMLERELQRKTPLFSNKLFQLMAEGEWSSFQPFCLSYSSGICAGFLQKNNQILSQSPVLGALSVATILKAQEFLPTTEKEVLRKQLIHLSQRIPKENKILKKSVSEALKLFPKKSLPPLSINRSFNRLS